MILEPNQVNDTHQTVLIHKWGMWIFLFLKDLKHARVCLFSPGDMLIKRINLLLEAGGLNPGQLPPPD